MKLLSSFEWLIAIYRAFWQSRRAHHAAIRISFPAGLTSGHYSIARISGAHMSLQLQTDAKVALTAAFTDQLGNVAPAPATPSWAVSDASIASLDSASGASVNLIAGAIGSCTVTMTAGSLTATLAVSVIAPIAVAASIVVGTPVAK